MTAQPERSIPLLAVPRAPGLSLRLIRIDGQGSFIDIDAELHYRHPMERHAAISVGRKV